MFGDRLDALSAKFGRPLSFRNFLYFRWEGMVNVCIRRVLVLHEIRNQAATISQIGDR